MRVAAIVLAALVVVGFATACRTSGIKAWKLAALLAVLEAGVAVRFTLLNP